MNKISLAVRGESLVVNRQVELEQTPTPEPVRYDPRRAHAHTSHKIGGIWRHTVEQDGRVFDRESGEILNLNIS